MAVGIDSGRAAGLRLQFANTEPSQHVRDYRRAKMEEQVVPGFAPTRASQSHAVPTLASVPARAAKAVDRAVPALPPPAKRSKTTLPISPAVEFAGKARWNTPLRVGRWKEKWESARELGLDVAVRSFEQCGVVGVVRSVIAEVVVASVGDLLPLETVQKWLCLLCEYLELNADEQVLVVCLLRKFVQYGGKFVGEGDWARPQRWECVVAIACYFSVLLTEEFPGRTSMDLRELLGPNFHFGREQVEFLKSVDWRISVSTETFKEAKECCINVANEVDGEKELLISWFRVDDAVADRKKRTENATAASAAAAAEAAKAAKAALAVHTPVQYNPVQNVKKRNYAAIAPAKDSMVPTYVPQFAAAVPQPFVAPGVIPTVPQWMPRPW